MTIEIRPPARDEWRAAADAFRTALLFPRMSDDDWAKAEPSWEETDSLTAWDGGRCVGHAGGFRLDTVVPGGARLETSGVTRVGVLPSHTRRGLLRTMMRRLLTEGRERGQVLASLRASEAPIYGRFGFGLAGEACEVEIDRRRAVMRPVEVPGSLRLLEPGEVCDVVFPLYDWVRSSRVGSVRRSRYLFERYLESAIKPDGQGRVVVHLDEAGQPDGYAHYSLAWQQRPDDFDRGTGELDELWGASADVEAALWRFLLEIDLVEVFKAHERPVDDVARWLLVDRRAYCVKQRWDEQWLRVLDADRALTARTYGLGPVVTLAVTDDLFADNAGTWRIAPEGAERVSGSAEPSADVATDASGLGAAYLGGTTWAELVGSQRATARSAAAVSAADSLFAVRPAPFCGSFF